ncbi:MAG TPA: PAS domain S-box protein [Stellaceae bacterium]|nr:PAS domain S-box protein [Stellaceae bacterium]
MKRALSKTRKHRDAERVLAAIIESSDAAIISKTLDGLVTSWNRSAERIFGYEASEMIGQPIGRLAAPDRPNEMVEILDRIRRGEPVEPHETKRRRKDGTVIPISLTVSPIFDESGRIVGASKIAHDLTETKLSQSIMKEREARLRSILETSPDAIITIDERGIIQSFSDAAAKMFGYEAGEVIGRNIRMLMGAEHHDKHDEYLARYRRLGEKRIIGIGREVQARRKDGTLFPIDLAVGEVKHGENTIYTGFIRDLTARKKMEQELRQAHKMEAVGQLTGGVAHDFNNLLTVISGNLEMLEARALAPDDLDLLREAQEATQLGATLAKRLLAFGRRQPLHPKLIDLNALVGGMTDLLRRSLGATIEIEIRLATTLPLILADPGEVENALLNLAVNARDAMGNGGKLFIETARTEIDEDAAAAYADLAKGRYVTLTVTDTGSGMTPEVRSRAFEPFYTTKPVGTGSGLGLSQVYGFVKQSGGHVQLYSEVGHGTTVRIYLPARDDNRDAEKASPDARNRHRRSGETILVVEDDPRVRRVSVRRLKELGYGVLEAENGAGALEQLEHGTPIDILFTDIVMAGGMTGVDLAKAARRLRPTLKILFTSGYAEPAVMKGGLLTKDASWLGKPYSTGELDAELRALLDH